MNDRKYMLRKIWEMDFALHELVLFLDTHPKNARALELTRQYRARRTTAIAEYEAVFGPYQPTADSTPAEGEWKWITGPWPWEFDGTEV